MTHALARSAALLACAMASGAALLLADNDRLQITSVVPAFAAPPQSSSILLNGRGFRGKGRRPSRPSVHLAAEGGGYVPLTVLDATDNTITARLTTVRAGTWRLIVSVGEHADSFDLTIGHSGPQGPSGLPGAVGVAGSVGPSGPAGAIGAIGPGGSQGVQGIPGDAGPAGLRGVRGPQGTTGDQGPIGPVESAGAAIRFRQQSLIEGHDHDQQQDFRHDSRRRADGVRDCRRCARRSEEPSRHYGRDSRAAAAARRGPRLPSARPRSAAGSIDGRRRQRVAAAARGAKRNGLADRRGAAVAAAAGGLIPRVRRAG